MMLLARSLLTTAFVAVVAVSATSCGNPTNGTQPGTVGAGSPTAIPTTSPELLDAINLRLAAHGEPTLPPGTDVSHGYPYDKTAEAIVDATDEARPTYPPGPLFCGPADARSGDIVMNHGPIRGGCALYGNDWIVTTSGDPTRDIPGILALYQCEPTDSSCVSGGEPAQQGQWQIFTSPIGEGVRIYSQRGSRLLILPGQYCFDLETLAWVDPCDWDATSTPAPAQTPSPSPQA